MQNAGADIILDRGAAAAAIQRAFQLLLLHTKKNEEEFDYAISVVIHKHIRRIFTTPFTTLIDAFSAATNHH